MLFALEWLLRHAWHGESHPKRSPFWVAAAKVLQVHSIFEAPGEILYQVPV